MLRSYACLAVLLVCLADPVKGFADQTPVYGGSATISVRTRLSSLNPFSVSRAVGGGLGGILYNVLVGFDDRLEPVPDLAESWSVSSDGLEWTFKLRDGVRFHDGVEVTSEDVVFTYRQLQHPSAGGRSSLVWSVLDSVHAPDNRTVVFRLQRPHADFLSVFGDPIVPAHCFDRTRGDMSEAFELRPIGTGPFRIVHWDNEGIVLTAFDEHFAGRPFLDELVVRYYPNRFAAWTALLRGNLDMVEDASYADVTALRGSSEFLVHDAIEPFYYTVVFNTTRPPFSDVRLRRAIDYAIDRTDLINVALNGAGEVARGPFLNGTWPAEALPGSDAGYGIRTSRDLLESAGWHDRGDKAIREKDGERLVIDLLFDEGDALKARVAARLKWQLLQIGVEVKVFSVDPYELVSERLVPGEYQAAILQFNVGVDPARVMPAFWSSEGRGRSNVSGFSDADLDSYLREAAEVADRAERTELYRQATQVLLDEVPAAFLFFPNRYVVVSAGLNVGNGARTHGAIFRTVREWHRTE